MLKRYFNFCAILFSMTPIKAMPECIQEIVQTLQELKLTSLQISDTPSWAVVPPKNKPILELIKNECSHQAELILKEELTTKVLDAQLKINFEDLSAWLILAQSLPAQNFLVDTMAGCKKILEEQLSSYRGQIYALTLKVTTNIIDLKNIFLECKTVAKTKVACIKTLVQLQAQFGPEVIAEWIR